MSEDTTEVPKVLVDGSAPATPDELFGRLGALEIAVRTFHHPPVFTVEEARALRGEIPGTHIKNLYLRGRKGGQWLIVCREERRIDLKALGELLGDGRLSFGSPKRLMEFLGVLPGAVSPFAAINDRSRAVKVALDRQLDGTTLNCHPLDNSMTTSIACDDLLRFLAAEDHAPYWLDFEAGTPPTLSG